MVKLAVLILASSIAVAATSLTAQGVTMPSGAAKYRLTFTSTWSQATFPMSFPKGAHYSSLVGGLHSNKVSFWRVGGTATQGLEAVAETGNPTRFANEVSSAITIGTARQVLRGSGLGTSPSSTSMVFTVDAEHSNLTLISMLAPSPDWFVGVDSLALIVKGRWVEKLVVPLHLYDSGTDSGTSYTSPNQNTSPKAAIGPVTTTSGPLQGTTGIVGSFTIERIGSALTYGCGVNPQGSMEITSGAPRIGQSITLTIDDPTGGMPSGTRTILFFALKPVALFPCGNTIPGFGLGTSRDGEVLVDMPFVGINGPVWNGAAVPIAISIPNQATLVGSIFYLQGALVDSSPRLGLTDAAEIMIGQ